MVSADDVFSSETLKKMWKVKENVTNQDCYELGQNWLLTQHSTVCWWSWQRCWYRQLAGWHRSLVQTRSADPTSMKRHCDATTVHRQQHYNV